jgi:hypothetical protein
MLPLRPQRGGYTRSFGCGIFTRNFLLGHGPEGSPAIDPERGACQADIFYFYKMALHKAYAEDAVDRENDQRIRDGKPIYNPEEYAERVIWYQERIPHKTFKARYHSFQRYFHWLKQLAWVEFTGLEEQSALQQSYPDAPPRKYYRLTEKGITAPDYEWSNPQLALYPERDLDYFRDKRGERRYSRKAPTRRRTGTADKS